MEDVLDVYERPYDPARPVVCLDETSKQLVAETRTPLPMAPAGRPRWRGSPADRPASTMHMNAAG